MERFKDGYIISFFCKVTCTGKTGRARAYNSNSVTVAIRFYRFFCAKCIVPVSDKALKSANTNTFALDTAYTF